jgi:hypothetical protein
MKYFEVEYGEQCRAPEYRDSVNGGGPNSKVNDQYAGKGKSEECGNQCLAIESRAGAEP